MNISRIPIRQRGFSLIELMVGALLGLIGTIVIFQVFSVSEEQKRATTGAGEAVQSSATALFQIQRDAMQAGFGFNKQLYGCHINGWYDNGQAGGQDLTLTLAPVTIVKGAGTDSDQVSFISSSSQLTPQPTGLLSTQSDPGWVRVLNRYGFKRGDLIVLMNYKEVDAAPYKKYCSLAQVSHLPTTSGLEDRIMMLPGTYVDDKGLTKQILYNKPGGLAAPKQNTHRLWKNGPELDGLVFNIGAFPRAVSYSVLDGQLVMGAGLKGTDPIPIADQVIQFRAHFGVDGNDDGQVSGSAAPVAQAVATLTGSTGPDHWAEQLPAPTATAPPSLGMRTPKEWSKILAIRMVLVTRGEKLRPNPSTGTCDATTTMPVWKANGNSILDVSADSDWRCFKYSVQEMTVPLRNLIWSTTELGIQPTSTSDL